MEGTRDSGDSSFAPPSARWLAHHHHARHGCFKFQYQLPVTLLPAEGHPLVQPGQIRWKRIYGFLVDPPRSIRLLLRMIMSAMARRASSSSSSAAAAAAAAPASAPASASASASAAAAAFVQAVSMELWIRMRKIRLVFVGLLIEIEIVINTRRVSIEPKSSMGGHAMTLNSISPMHAVWVPLCFPEKDEDEQYKTKVIHLR